MAVINDATWKWNICHATDVAEDLIRPEMLGVLTPVQTAQWAVPILQEHSNVEAIGREINRATADSNCLSIAVAAPNGLTCSQIKAELKFASQ